ncbi:alpha/beta-hydrolase [Gymnopus androsaceus JB14]|uniref:Carboxypeptidase n=1 Tax=Gymnopus androsaceus JB14 TaxID=1447944 RepID=A0A6A4HAG5_9AGAR|nr:alpha/beta-hydrolase [Gymnopus androsaceus JB14]
MFSRSLGILALLCGAIASQVPLTPVNASAGGIWSSGTAFSNSEFFTPLETLSNVKDSEFSILGHPFFPRYSVRIKKSDFCDPTVNAYSGYIDIQARHLFFYFFESRNDPDTDDVLFWTNGGTNGCSSSLGLFMELGPCRVLDEDGPKFHSESWNTNANIFFIDQPVGVGFSYAEYGETVSTTEEAAQDIAAFVAIFFEHFTKFKGRGFHMAGESYAGRYLPLFASAVYDQNRALVDAGMTPINLTSVMIGNGITDFETMVPAYYDMACTPASVEPVLDIGTCVAMKNTLPRCKKWMRESCVDQYDAINCYAAMSFCQSMLEAPYFASGNCHYHHHSRTRMISAVPCNGTVSTTLCYPMTVSISNFLSQPEVRTQLGVDTNAVPANFSSCARTVGAGFSSALDSLHTSKYHVSALLDRGVRVLIYVGSYDWICNWVGNERWSKALEWSGHEAFASQELREWTVNGKKAGITRSAKGFTFATVEGAGHMVPYDKPKESLMLVQRWMAGEEL